MTNEEVFRTTLIQDGIIPPTLGGTYVNRMSQHRIPRLLLLGVLKERTRPIKRPRLRFKNVVKRDLKDFNIEPVVWTYLSTDRAS